MRSRQLLSMLLTAAAVSIASVSMAFAGGFDYASVPAYSGNPSVIVNGNEPFFTDSDITVSPYLSMDPLDSLGRCGVSMCCTGPETLPDEDRGSIGMIKPSGWQTPQSKYDFVDGKFLYNRGHSVMFALYGNETNDPRNLSTITRYCNVDGMLEYENKALNYVKSSKKHIIYRVTPIFSGSELVCRGMLMECMSAEDKGAGLKFCVFAYNVQPGVDIDYATGKNSRNSDDPKKAVYTYGGSKKAAGVEGTEETVAETAAAQEEQLDYIVNTNSSVFHKPDCSNAAKISGKNRKKYHGYRSHLISNGYKPGGCCNP